MSVCVCVCFRYVVDVLFWRRRCLYATISRSLSLCVSQNHQKKKTPLSPTLNFSVLINIIIVINRRLSQQHTHKKKKKLVLILTVLSRQNCCSSSIIIKQASLDTHIYIYICLHTSTHSCGLLLFLWLKRPSYTLFFFLVLPFSVLRSRSCCGFFSPLHIFCILVALLFSSCLPVVLFTSFIPLLLLFFFLLFTLTCCFFFFSVSVVPPAIRLGFVSD